MHTNKIYLTLERFLKDIEDKKIGQGVLDYSDYYLVIGYRPGLINDILEEYKKNMDIDVVKLKASMNKAKQEGRLAHTFDGCFFNEYEISKKLFPRIHKEKIWRKRRAEGENYWERLGSLLQTQGIVIR